MLMAMRRAGLIGWGLLAVPAAASTVPLVPAMTAAGEAKKRNYTDQARDPDPVLSEPFHDPVLSVIV
jgi:hypothetical protein